MNDRVPPPTSRTRVRRIAERGHYDSATIHRIVDAAWHCHVAFVDAENSVHCIPTACWRKDDTLYIHGSNGSRLLKTLAEGVQACVTVSHIDGLVLARSAFHHSMNYRSVIIYGRFERVTEEDKPAVLNGLLHHVAAGREFDTRAPDRNELAATLILSITMAEAAAKIREGGPKDDEADMSLPHWAGVIPLREQRLSAQRDPGCGAEMPAYLRDEP